jgi:pyrroloquinoline quinone (PQQ) biosynthesis protein C
MAKSIEQLTREKFGGSARTPFNQVKMNYYISQGIAKAPLNQMEKLWLKKVILDNAGTPVGKYNADLLAQALVAKGITPTKIEKENWLRLMLSL